MAATARAEDGLPRPAGAAPADVFTIQQSRPLEGFSFGAGAVTQFLRLPATGSTPRDDRIGHDLQLTGSVWGYLQLDVALPVRFYLSGRSRPDGTVDTRLQAGLAGLRLTGKLAIPGVHRRFDGAGLGVALLFGVDLPTAVPKPRETTWRPAIVVDRRWVLGHGFRLLLAGNLGVALRQDEAGQLARTSITYGGAAKFLLIPPWHVSAFAGVDGALGVMPALQHGGANLFAGFQWFGERCYNVSITGGVRLGEPGGLGHVGWFIGVGFGRLWGGECRAQREPDGDIVIGSTLSRRSGVIATTPVTSASRSPRAQDVQLASFTPPPDGQLPPPAQEPQRKAPDTGATTPAEPSPLQALAEIDRQLHHQIEALFAGLDRVQSKPAVRIRGLFEGDESGLGVSLLRSTALRDIKGIVDTGWGLAQKAGTKAEPARSRHFQAAGACFEAAQILIQIVKIQIDLLIVTSYANTAGTPFAPMLEDLRAFDAVTWPLIQAAFALDPARMKAALARVEPVYQRLAEAIDPAVRAVDKNAQLSAQVIQIANVVTLAMAIYDVSRIPVVRGGGGIGTSGPPPAPVFNIAGLSAGGAAVLGRGIDVRALAAAAEAVRKLVAIGALDAGVIAAIANLGGGAGTLAEFQKPSLLWMEGRGSEGKGPKQPPKNLPAFPSAIRAQSKTPVQGGGKLRRRWKDADGNILEWDYQHGTVEKYDKRGRHLGEFDPETRVRIKAPDKTKSVEP